METSPGPLAGIRIIDLSTGIGGPFCAKLLADYGADVIKVEPRGGDPSRRLPPFPDANPGPERSAAFLYLNTNKRSIVLDVEQPADRETLLRLIDGAHAVVESFAPGRLDALGLGWETLRARNPALVLTSVTPFGQDGPYAGFKGPNLVALALGGQMSMTGDPDKPPLKAGGQQAEYQAGLNAFAATAIALLAAQRDGRGDHLDIGAMPCMASTLEASLPFYAYLGLVTGVRRGNTMSFAIGIYPCADGFLGVHAMARNWAPLAETMGMPELATDERFRTQRARMEANDEIVAILYAWAADQKKKEVYARAGTMRGPIAYVHTLEDLLQSPHLRARGFLHEVDHPRAGRLVYPGNPFSMTDSPWRAGRAPLLDEHRAEIVREALTPRPPLPILGEGVPSPTRVASSEPRHTQSDIDTGEPVPIRHPLSQDWERGAGGEGRPPPPLPLAGVRILDLTMVWAGPYATRLLGDMGAEVIKVESARFWDLLRSLHGLPGDDRAWNKSAYFNHNNRDKYGMSLDLADERGRDLFLRLVATCDVVIENYRADVLDRLGLNYETLRAAKDDIILVSMPGHGKTGPEKDFVAYGTNVEQLAGLVSLTGYEDGPPQKSGISYGDPIAGITAAGAVALALIHRDRTGRGQYVELAQRETLTALIGEEVVGYSMTGRLPDRLGNRDRQHAPHNVYPCAGDDSWIAIACTTDEEFAALCRVIGRPDLATDPRYRERAARHANQIDLDPPIAAWTATRDHYAAMTELQAAGVPAGAVLSVPELFMGPHLRARGFWEQIAHPDAGVWDVDGVAWRLHERPAHVRFPAPRFAEHNEYVYRHLFGLDEATFDTLRSEGVIGETPDLSIHQ
jgi:crotonobetainyl-CoA:carnitine CoA-transferase CaiB-like acyl-CoA transferase